MKRPVHVESLILSIRHQNVIIDADLAELYGVATKALNQAVKRNADRFPGDFMFQLTSKELSALRSQIVTSKAQSSQVQYDGALRSQFATSKRGGRRTRPYAFTEHGALMAANVLNSPEAVAMSVYVVRAFIKQRELLRTHQRSSKTASGSGRSFSFPHASGQSRLELPTPMARARSSAKNNSTANLGIEAKLWLAVSEVRKRNDEGRLAHSPFKDSDWFPNTRAVPSYEYLTKHPHQPR